MRRVKRGDLFFRAGPYFADIVNSLENDVGIQRLQLLGPVGCQGPHHRAGSKKVLTWMTRQQG
jgi:hypothetical protein